MGVNHKRIQRKLLAQENLTYEKAYTGCVSREASERNAIKLQNSRAALTRPLPIVPPISEEKVLYTASWKPSKGTTITCYHCRGAHLAS